MKSLDHLEKYKDDKIDIDDWNKKYKEGINKLINIAYNIKNKNNKNENNNNNKIAMNLLKKEYDNINKINCDINRKPFEIFSEINKKEGEMYKIINNYKLNTNNQKIMNKINSMFISLENEIDLIILQLEE